MRVDCVLNAEDTILRPIVAIAESGNNAKFAMTIRNDILSNRATRFLIVESNSMV